MRCEILMILIGVTFFASAQKQGGDSSRISINFINKAGNDTVELGNEYKNAFNEPYTIVQLKYYISNISFTTSDGTVVNDSGYYLVDEAIPASKTIALNSNKNNLTQLSFLIGVDSAKNVSGTQVDALDPMNGMFWTWNSGYIMAKIEATSLLSKLPNNAVSLHIGGFRYNQNVTRKVTLPLKFAKGTQLLKGEPTTIFINADINRWFNGIHELRITDHTACTTPGVLAVKYADNYATMFEVDSIKN